MSFHSFPQTSRISARQEAGTVSICLFLFLLALLPGCVTGAEEGTFRISGSVFLDVNENGFRDPSEKGMAGVHVSDGDRILGTAKDGQYTIETTTSIPNTVFAVNPDGYISSGPFHHRVINDATGIDFGMRPQPPTGEDGFSFYHAADYQFGNAEGSLDQIQGDLDDMEAFAKNRGVRFYTFVGDITPHGTLPSLRFFKERFDGLQRPFHALFGGHDGLAEMERPKMGNFVEVFGPYAYSWNYGGVHFIGLVSEGFLSEFERERQMRWWKRDMELQPEGTPIVVLAHVPDSITAELEEAAQNHNLIAMLFGHWHTHYQYEVDGVPLVVSGPWRPFDWGVFTKRARIITYKEGRLSSTTRVLGQKKRLAILHPGPQTDPGPLPITVCAYDTVTVPEGVSATIRSPKDRKTWVQDLARRDDWTWIATTSQSLAPGRYELNVVVDGEDPWSIQENFVVEDKPSSAVGGGGWTSISGSDPGTRSCTAQIKTPLNVEWVAPLGSAQPYFGSPIVSGGRVYQGVADGQVGFENAGVACFDIRSGEQIWKASLPRDIYSTVCTDGRRVYALDCQGTVYALSAEDGSLDWKNDAYEGTGFYDSNKFSWRFFVSPLTHWEGKVLVTGSRILAGFSAETGERIWQDYGNVNRSSPYPSSGLMPGKGLGYFEDENRVAAINLESGDVVWNKPLSDFSGDTPRERGTASPLYTSEGVYFHHRSHLRGIDPKTGDEIWTASKGGPLNYVSIPAVSGRKVVVASANQILCFDVDSGSCEWTFKTRSAEETELGKYQQMSNGSSPAIAGGKVFVGSDDGYFYVLDLESGEKLWEYNTGTPIKASPAISGDFVIVSNFAGNVFAFASERK